MNPTKSSQRRLAYDARNAQAHRPRLSKAICAQVLEHQGYQQARTVLWYLHCRSEVHTFETVMVELLKQDKQIIIPYCTQDKQGHKCLGLWHLEDLSELVGGMWGILEPPRDRWGEPGKEIHASALDLVVTPGVAFDRQGGRLGNGAGYYDRLFAQLKPHTCLIGIGFESQMVAQVIMQDHDVYLDAVMTEVATYQGRGRLV